VALEAEGSESAIIAILRDTSVATALNPRKRDSLLAEVVTTVDQTRT